MVEIGEAEQHEALLIKGMVGIGHVHSERVGKYGRGLLKRHAVLALVRGRFLRVPLEFIRHTSFYRATGRGAKRITVALSGAPRR